VECSEVFPFGVGMVGVVQPLADFERSTRENKIQQLDPNSGQPVWIVDVIDFDPEARERTFKVKILSRSEPQSPPAVEGPVPVRPVHLEGLQVMPYQKSLGADRDGNERIKIAYSLRASGISAPSARRTSGSSSSSGSGSSGSGSSGSGSSSGTSGSSAQAA